MDERQNLPSASAWRRYTLCPGSFQLEDEARTLGQEALGDPRYADAGTRIHAHLAGKKVELSESELETAEFLRKRAEEQVGLIFQGQPFNVLKEKRLWLEL